MTDIIELPVSQITPGNNDRKVFDQAKLRELANSIAEHGLAQPITVRPLNTCAKCSYTPPRLNLKTCPHCGSDDWVHTTYQIVAGERRFRAISQVLRRETAPCIIRPLSDEEASGIMLAENTGRADLNPIEEANAYHERMAEFGWSEARCAKTAGVSEDLVKRRLSLRKLNPEIQHLVANGHFPIGHAEAIADLDPNRQRIAVRIYREAKNGLSLTPFRKIVSDLLEEQSQNALFDLENFWIEQVQNETLPTSGKRAVTGAPTRSDLPPVPTTNKMSDRVGHVIDRYIADLLEAGFHSEAAAVGNLYNALVSGNYASVPKDSRLLKTIS